ncbi:uncharacterized protein PFL1_00728 [Pseudozyma flocculosa PF-1]|uniref:LYR motif-containing protein 2 n=1 Tax=Pseudozyma flocculosa TaxID=84751 RepID=A0A5C3F580_9BASI|nr:uncharacterized protein PFL1_00728 [Pseudozyma flocculosa PF-1]EPQ31393.1 hypothetical protein PFL1_00728 [Pseudozyma flocculosa PF-1]SPO38827.1 uncharacterized protein PSFLO_04306 [Pseudozyma flocculosa]
MTIPTLPLRARAHFAGAKLTLEHFVLRSKALGLYRDFLRATRDIPNPEARWETIQFFRSDFDRYKHEDNLDRIRDLLTQGTIFLKQMQGQMTLSAASSGPGANKLRGLRTPK